MVSGISNHSVPYVSGPGESLPSQQTGLSCLSVCPIELLADIPAYFNKLSAQDTSSGVAICTQLFQMFSGLASNPTNFLCTMLSLQTSNVLSQCLNTKYFTDCFSTIQADYQSLSQSPTLPNVLQFCGDMQNAFSNAFNCGPVGSNCGFILSGNYSTVNELNYALVGDASTSYVPVPDVSAIYVGCLDNNYPAGWTPTDQFFTSIMLLGAYTYPAYANNNSSHPLNPTQANTFYTNEFANLQTMFQNNDFSNISSFINAVGTAG